MANLLLEDIEYTTETEGTGSEVRIIWFKSSYHVLPPQPSMGTVSTPFRRDIHIQKSETKSLSS
jgi:hypothetical protein